MNGSAIIQFIDRVNDAVKAASPIATMMGAPFLDKITSWVDVATEVAENGMKQAEEGKIVLNSNDKAEIERKLVNIQAVNDEIAANIAAG